MTFDTEKFTGADTNRAVNFLLREFKELQRGGGGAGEGQITNNLFSTVPTVFVAAADATEWVKEAAFEMVGGFVCDGVEDQSELQAAIDALPAGGGRIVTSEGSFSITSKLTIPGNLGHVRLEGLGSLFDWGALGTNYIETSSPFTMHGVTFTNDDDGLQQPHLIDALDGAASLQIYNNVFRDMTILLGVAANLASGTSPMICANNIWDNIHIYKPFTNGALFYAKDGDGFGVFEGNVVRDITSLGSGGTAHLVWSDNIGIGNIFAIGNYIKNATWNGIAGGTAVAVHNILDGAVADDLAGHGTLPSNISNFSQTGELAVGTGSFKLPFTTPATIISVQIAVGTSPTGSDLIVDLNKNGTTVFTSQGNRPTVPAGDADGVGAETVPDITSIAEGEYLTVDIDQVGATVPGSDLTVSVEWEPT